MDRLGVEGGQELGCGGVGEGEEGVEGGGEGGCGGGGYGVGEEVVGGGRGEEGGGGYERSDEVIFGDGDEGGAVCGPFYATKYVAPGLIRLAYNASVIQLISEFAVQCIFLAFV